LGRWKYAAAVPTLFGIGISPLAQLALTGIISLIFIKKSDNKIQDNNTYRNG